jgi:Fe-S cluster assembly iron-binding protein IscA
MFTLSEAAGAHLVELLEEVDAPPQSAIRFVIEGDTLELRLDQQTDDDETIEHRGETVVVLDPEVAELLDGRTLEVVHDDDGARLCVV